ncbi:PD40 domain-containing protein [Pelagicoccus mobilis]|uniref:PD40 domain-containing protein n=1 Tax=Pelagicoccus mobilis TaxID=415221 RepID=A0A934RZC4_9BACT|nr:PD40 domain-containing protein [Pelagicoccus mobilis]MBK1877092.1 PD40 domain-containing protein [Pelagicoccus mobilis]
MRIHFSITVFLTFTASILPTLASARTALEVESVESALPYNFVQLHTDTIAQFNKGVWDLESGEQLAGPEGNLGYLLVLGLLGYFNSGTIDAIPDRGLLLDFDPTSLRAAYRTRLGGLEVRTTANEVIFESPYVDRINQKEAFLIDDGKYVLIRTRDKQDGTPILVLYSLDSGEEVWERRGPSSVSWAILDNTLACLELKPSENAEGHRIATLFNLVDSTEIAATEVSVHTGQPETDPIFDPFRKPRELLIRETSPVFFQAYNTGTLIADGINQDLTTIDDIQVRNLPHSSEQPWGKSSESDSPNRYHVAIATQFSDELPYFFIIDAQEKEVVSTSLELRREEDMTSQGNHHAISSDGQLFFKAMSEGPIEVWDLRSKSFVKEINIPGVTFDTMLSSKDSRYLFVNGYDEQQSSFAAMIDIETGLPSYQIEFSHTNAFEYTTDGDLAPAYKRRPVISPDGRRIYFQSLSGIESFDFKTGIKIDLSTKFRGSAITTRFVESQSGWVTVYETGKVSFESTDGVEGSVFFQLPNDRKIQFATIDERSGSIAFKREWTSYRQNGESYVPTYDYSIVVVHPFDDRVDQNLPLDHDYYEESKLKLLGGGRWLVAPYSGIFDLETLQPYDTTRFVSTKDAYHYETGRWADKSGGVITVTELEKGTSTILDTSELFGHIRALRFSEDGSRLYCLTSPTSYSHQQQSIHVLDSSDGTLISQMPITSLPGTSEFWRMQLSKDEDQILLSDESAIASILDLKTNTSGIPIELGRGSTYYSLPTYFEIAPPLSSGESRSIDANGNLYILRPITTHPIRCQLTASLDTGSELSFPLKNDRRYWIQASDNLVRWETYRNTDFIESWFDSNDKGFFRVYESDGSN